MPPRAERAPFIDISRKAQGIMDGSIPVESLLPPKNFTPMAEKEAARIYASHKADVYALTGVYVSLLVDSVVKESEAYPPLGLSKLTGEGGGTNVTKEEVMGSEKSPFSQVNLFLLKNLINARSGIMADGKTVKRFKEVEKAGEKWSEFYKTYIPLGDLPSAVDGVEIRNTWEFINPALTNAVNFMTGMASLVPQIIARDGFNCSERNTSPGDILNSSFYIPQAFASTDLDKFSRALIGVLNVSRILPMGRANPVFPENGIFFYPKPFGIESFGDDSHRLSLQPDYMPERNPQAMKCPALVNILGDSAIKKLWDRTVKTSRVVYPLMQAE